MTGFSFERVGTAPPTSCSRGATKTGTTICGLVFPGGVVLGADTRSTNGETVADKNCAKIHYVAPNIYCCGAGTAADTEAVTGTVASELLLHRCSINRPNRVVTALNILKTRLFKYQGHIGAALILGGVDKTGAHLHSIYPHGSSDSLPYASMGSGSLAAMAMLENEYRDGLSLEDAKGLICRAIHAGILNDLGSGSNVDLCVITRDGVQQLRNYQMFNQRTHTRDGKFLDAQIPDINTSNLRTATLCSLP